MKRFAACVALIFLAGCVPPELGDIQTEYSKSARQLGLYPVYPPREEFQIGDIYMISSKPNEPDGAISIYLGSSKQLQNDASAFLNSRVLFKDTTAKSTDDPFSQADLFNGTIQSRGSVSAKQDAKNSLPIAAFPSFTADATRSASLGLGGVLQSLGLVTANRTSVTLDFNSVRTYWVPRVLARNNVWYAIDTATNAAPGLIHELDREVLSKTEGKENATSHQRCIRFAFVTRVYLTRQIEYTYRNDEIVAAGLRRAAPGSDLSSAPAPQFVNIALTGGSNGQPVNLATGTVADIQNRLAATNARGLGISFSKWDGLGITLSRTYQKPVAVGWNGFEFPFPKPENTNDYNYKDSKRIYAHGCR